MGSMKQLWNVQSITQKLENKINRMERAVIDELMIICMAIAQRAKENHEYRNYKGQLESSTGVIIIKDRQKIVNYEWSSLATDGDDPSLGLRDFRDFINENIVGKARLSDGTFVPKKSIVGIVVAAAPYAEEVELRGRKVLFPFVVKSVIVKDMLKEVIDNV